ncbi:MAG: PEP-CTERM sorting domain-containing protein [Verrucomicrobiota bacterium JB023]|nr:PEP-CTERM sorting domain-containing protein [Verrucomicrobiota bacterium JB023]
MSRTALTTFAASLLAPAALTAATIHVDFGRADNQATGNYNSVTGPGGTTLSTPSVPLIDDTGASTGITLNTDFSNGGSWAGTGADYYTGPYVGSLAGIDEAALIDSLFIRSPAFVTITLVGLDTETSYGLVLYGARGNNAGDFTTYSITDGAGTTELQLNALNNITAVEASGLVADGNGEITLVMTTTSSGTNGALNYLGITTTPIPEPSAMALFLLSGLGLLNRKRS